MNQQEQKPQADDKAGKTQQPAAFPGPSAATFSDSFTNMIAPSNQQKDDQVDSAATLNTTKQLILKLLSKGQNASLGTQNKPFEDALRAEQKMTNIQKLIHQNAGLGKQRQMNGQ